MVALSQHPNLLLTQVCVEHKFHDPSVGKTTISLGGIGQKYGRSGVPLTLRPRTTIFEEDGSIDFFSFFGFCSIVDCDSSVIV